MQHFEMFKHYVLDDAWDEMRLPDGMARPQYQELLRRMSQVTAQELASRQRVADDTFLAQGVTFTVYGHEDGTEKIFLLIWCHALSPTPSGARSSAD